MSFDVRRLSSGGIRTVEPTVVSEGPAWALDDALRGWLPRVARLSIILRRSWEIPHKNHRPQGLRQA